MASNTNKNPEVEITIPIFSPKNEQNPKMEYCPSPEISKMSPSPNPNPSPNKPPKYPSPEAPLMRQRTFNKGKPKSRFGEPSVPIDSQTLENFGSPRCDSFEFDPQTPNSIRASSFAYNDTPKAKEREKGKGNEGPDEKEIYQRVTAQLSARNTKKMVVKYLCQLLVFSLLLGLLVSSLTVKRFRNEKFLGLEDWKWFVLLMVIFSGMLVTHWVVHLVVFFIEWKFLLKKNLVYFTHALKTNVEVFIWISLVLATWVLLIKSHIETTPRKEKILDFVTWTLVSLLIGSFMWLIKTTLIKMLASSFHLNRFFDRIQEAVFHHYVLQMLSGRPVVELARYINREENSAGQVSFTEHTNNHTEKKVVDWGKLHQMKQEKVPSWTMKLLVDVMLNSGLSTMSGMLEKDVVEGGVALDDDEITSEEEAIATAVRIYENVVGDKDDQSYIDRSDLHRFLIGEEVNVIYPLFEVNDKGQVSLRAFSKWVVKIYKDRQALQHALNDNKTAVKQLNKLLCALLVVLVVILWLLLTEIATTKVVLFFSSQLVVAAFIFGNTAKTMFEAIIFVFVMHPFDVGDRCLIDGTMMLVEEMNILTTVFLKADKQKLYYPNSVLATKCIGNFYRSPDQGDSFEFSIDYSTPLSKIGKLKDRIKQYLELNPVYWHPEHSVVVREIENINKINIALFFNHTMNFQDIVTKNMRRTELVLEMKNIFDELDIRYNLLPQEIQLKNMTANS